DNLTLFEVLDNLGTLLRTALFKNGTTRNDDIAATLVHLEDFEWLRRVHERADVADRTDVNLAARQEGNGAVEIDGEATLDLVEDHAFNALALVELLFETNPAFLAASLFTAEHGFTKRVLDALDVDFYFIAGAELAVLGLGPEFLERNTACYFQTDINDGHVFFDGRNDALYDGTFNGRLCAERFVEKARKIVARRI